MIVWLLYPSNDNCTELFGVQEVESAASTINSKGQPIFIADAQRDDGKALYCARRQKAQRVC